MTYSKTEKPILTEGLRILKGSITPQGKHQLREATDQLQETYPMTPEPNP